MTKADLKKKWSKYCDTDQLVDDAMALFKKYRHRHSVHGICVMLDKYFTNKESLIQLFMNSDNYIGNMRIAVQKEFDRVTNNNEVYHMLYEFDRRLPASELLKYKDDENKTFDEHLPSGKMSFNIDNLPGDEEQEEKLAKLRVFDYSTKTTIDSLKNYYQYGDYLNFFRKVYTPTLPCNASYRNGPELKKGTKTSRAFNQICTHFGIDKLYPEEVATTRNGETTIRTVYPYDKLFAQYADLVSELKRKLYFVISLNPLDYLTMSVGVNWRSCHNIENGGWKGGCMSYMLDSTSIITYVVNILDDKIHDIPKYYRQMYHYDNDLFIQNRLYPQGNDGATDLYEKFRGFVIEEFSDLIDVNNEWECKSGVGSNVRSFGAHYRDYGSNFKCATFYPRARATKARNHVMDIGHNGVCIYCGREFTQTHVFSHVDCVI